ncbi:MAG: galactokinase [Planctomycetota bacterium]
MMTHEASLTADRFVASIRERFGSDPIVVGRAPGRVNLIGDHVDYCGGVVLPMAIPQACFCGVVGDDSLGDRLAISTAAFESEVILDTKAPLEPGTGGEIGSWASYPIGVIAGLGELSDLSKLAGQRVHLESEVPLGGGLSSSASLEVSTATAVAHFLGIDLHGLQLAKLCQRAEHRFAGMPCGLMDQAVSVLGAEGHAIRLDCADDEVVRVPIPSEASFLVFHSGVSHALADGEYGKRRAACERSTALLGVDHLARADASAIDGLPEDLKPFARHVITETSRVNDACTALKQGELDRFGTAMSESHASLRDDFRVSCVEVDRLCQVLSEASGCLGARMTGGGFGGCVVALAMPGSEASLVEAAEGARDACPDMSLVQVRPSAGASIEC